MRLGAIYFFIRLLVWRVLDIHKIMRIEYKIFRLFFVEIYFKYLQLIYKLLKNFGILLSRLIGLPQLKMNYDMSFGKGTGWICSNEAGYCTFLSTITYTHVRIIVLLYVKVWELTDRLWRIMTLNASLHRCMILVSQLLTRFTRWFRHTLSSLLRKIFDNVHSVHITTIWT